MRFPSIVLPICYRNVPKSVVAAHATATPYPCGMNREQRLADWATKKADGVKAQLDALPQAEGWRERQRIAKTAERLRREEARLRAMALGYAA